MNDVPDGLLTPILTLAGVQIILVIAALIVLFRTPKDRLRHLSRPMWVVAILIANFAGAVAFLVVGRERTVRGKMQGFPTPSSTFSSFIDRFPHQIPKEPPGYAIKVTGLHKSFGKHQVLTGMDLDVPTGSVFGFLGPNGSGKTTALKIFMGLAHADRGSVHLLGTDASTVAVRERIGFLPDVPAFDPWMTAQEYLSFVGSARGLSGNALSTSVSETLVLAGLDRVDRTIGGFSRGMRQKLGIAQALLATPELVILDEPTSALDPIARGEVLELIDALRGRTTVFFSTHSMSDVEQVCDHAAFLGSGGIAATGTVPELIRQYGDPGRLIAEFRSSESSPSVTTETAVKALADAGFTDVEVRVGADSLGTAFATAVGGSR